MNDRRNGKDGDGDGRPKRTLKPINRDFPPPEAKRGRRDESKETRVSRPTRGSSQPTRSGRSALRRRSPSPASNTRSRTVGRNNGPTSKPRGQSPPRGSNKRNERAIRDSSSEEESESEIEEQGHRGARRMRAPNMRAVVLPPTGTEPVRDGLRRSARNNRNAAIVDAMIESEEDHVGDEEPDNAEEEQMEEEQDYDRAQEVFANPRTPDPIVGLNDIREEEQQNGNGIDEPMVDFDEEQYEDDIDNLNLPQALVAQREDFFEDDGEYEDQEEQEGDRDAEGDEERIMGAVRQPFLFPPEGPLLAHVQQVVMDQIGRPLNAAQRYLLNAGRLALVDDGQPRIFNAAGHGVPLGGALEVGVPEVGAPVANVSGVDDPEAGAPEAGAPGDGAQGDGAQAADPRRIVLGERVVKEEPDLRQLQPARDEVQQPVRRMELVQPKEERERAPENRTVQVALPVEQKPQHLLNQGPGGNNENMPEAENEAFDLQVDTRNIYGLLPADPSLWSADHVQRWVCSFLDRNRLLQKTREAIVERGLNGQVILMLVDPQRQRREEAAANVGLPMGHIMLIRQELERRFPALCVSVPPYPYQDQL